MGQVENGVFGRGGDPNGIVAEPDLGDAQTLVLAAEDEGDPPGLRGAPKGRGDLREAPGADAAMILGTETDDANGVPDGRLEVREAPGAVEDVRGMHGHPSGLLPAFRSPNEAQGG